MTAAWPMKAPKQVIATNTEAVLDYETAKQESLALVRGRLVKVLQRGVVLPWPWRS